MNKILFKENFQRTLRVLKKIVITLLCIIGLLATIAIWVFWRVGTIRGLDSTIDLKTQQLGYLFFCKEKAEESHPAKDRVYRKGVHDLTANYKFQVEAGYCPANKDEAKNIEPARIKLCKEIKSDLEEFESKSFKKPLRSAKQRYDEDFVAKGSCPPVY